MSPVRLAPGGTGPLGMFTPFLKAKGPSSPFWCLFPVWCFVWFFVSSFPSCWRQVNITTIPKGPPSSSVENYRTISIKLLLSKLFNHLPTTQFDCPNGLGIYSGQDARIVQIDLAFDRVNHHGIFDDLFYLSI